MDIKQLEVEKWLQSIYGLKVCVPEYEKNSKSIDLLYQLMTCSRNTEAKAQILLQDCISKTEEYRAKGEQITSILQGINLAKTNLSLEAQQVLSNIADAACAVNAFSPSETDIMLGYNRLEIEHDKVTDKCDAAHHLQAQLFDLSQQLASKLEHITSLEQQAAAAEALEQQELEGNRKRELFHEKKVAEYQVEICNREAELKHRGYAATSTHDIAHERWQQLLELREKVSSLQHKLESYSLPPDVTTARLAVEEMRHTLNALMSDVATLQMK